MEDFNQLFDDDLLEIDHSEDKTLRLKQGERRMVAVLFADIKGFTALSEVLDHEEVQTLIDQLMKIFIHRFRRGIPPLDTALLPRRVLLLWYCPTLSVPPHPLRSCGSTRHGHPP